MTDAEYRIDPEEAVAAAIDAAEEIDDSDADGLPGKPRLLVDKSNPHQTVATLRDILAEAGGLYDRGVPVRLAVDQTQKSTVAQMMTRSGVVLRAHQVCRPYALKKGDPQGRGRQYLAVRLGNLVGARIAGFVLTREEAIGRWGKATYALKKTSEDGDHRGHRGHRDPSQSHDANGSNHAGSEGPMTPMTPMPSAAKQQEAPGWRGRI